ncbi:MurR/RpiR family transcriptional regulator [Clostridium drakei]|uniref:MurR/RpiR family transcriptional regulator n=1 Tax=Clostridium drakei TaxID=332101 RepID=A0A2U8DUK8_9CLOT|nr:MurR/RpiR family transcriptional regulator [Clostridium drakei]AWI06310.1 MurR/RpiR family transcriptional regulator [Clostridium drakei]
MQDNLFTTIRSRYNTLSKIQKNIADYILSNKNEAVRLTISDLAQKCSVSEPTVIRFINKLDYNSYQTFRIDMAGELSKENTTAASSSIINIADGYQNIEASDSIETVKQKVVSSAACAINDLNNIINIEDLNTAVNLILNSDSILFYGSGGSSVIAMDAYHKFMRIGKRVSFDINSHFSLIKTSHLKADDVVVLISHTGESREVLECAENAKKAGCKIIGITSYLNSSLAKISDVSLFSSTYDLKYYTDAMVSRLIQLVILDMIFISVSLKMGDESKKMIEKSRDAISVAKKSIMK